MNYMLRILKFPASNGFINDIATAYLEADLTKVNINKTDYMIVVTNSSYSDLVEVKAALVGPVTDVSGDPATPYEIVRQYRHSVNLSTEQLATAYAAGKLYLTEEEFNAVLVDHL